MRTRIITTIDELNSLSSQWKHLANDSEFPTICSNPSFICAWWRAFGQSLLLRVLVIEDEVGVRLIAPFYTNPADKQLRLLGDCFGDFNSIVFRHGDRDSVSLLRHWLQSDRDWEKVRLQNLPINSLLLEPFHSAPPSCSPFLRRMSVWSKLGQPPACLDVCDNFPFVDLRSGACGKLLERSKDRQHTNWFKRQGKFTYQCYTDRESCLSLLPKYFALHRKEWGTRNESDNASEDSAKLSLWFDDSVPSSPLPVRPNRQLFEYLVEELSPQGIVRFDVLSLDDNPVAMHFGFADRGRVYYYKSAYDLEFKSRRPGRLLIVHVLRQAMELGLDELDFCGGRNPYKLEYASGIRQAGTLTLYRTIVHAALEGLRKLTRRMCS
jgi:hypothetical protein